MHAKKIIMLVMISVTTAHAKEKKYGLVIQPIADLVGAPIKKFYPHVATPHAYTQIPLNRGFSGQPLECPRLHQALFNETIEIIEEREHETLIKISNAFYLAHNTLKNDYWIAKKAYIPYEKLKKHGVDFNKIPAALNAKTHIHDNAIATLEMPFFDATTNTTYSAGTRFVMADEQADEHNIAVHAFNTQRYGFTILHIPEDIISFADDAKTTEQTVEHFVAILKKWAHTSQGFIPYVWGGCSFTHTSNTQFQEQSIKKRGAEHTYIDIADFRYTPKPGFDCSNMILRAAHIAGMPYYYKNSSAIAKFLPSIKHNETIEIGDIIWIPGHVMVVSDVDKNLLIEARGYNQGYGKVQEIELNKVFKDIDTYDDLHQAVKAKKTLCRLDNMGEVADSCNNGVKVFKIRSIWH